MAYLSREARHKQIVDAAVTLVTREGLTAATVRRIAHELGCSPGQIHHHFTSADGLRAEAVRRFWSDLQPKLTVQLAALAPRKRLTVILSGQIDEFGGDTGQLLVVAKRLWKDARDIPKEPMLKEALAEGIRWLFVLVSDALIEGSENGTFPRGLAIPDLATRLIAASQGFDLLLEIDPALGQTASKTELVEGHLVAEGI